MADVVKAPPIGPHHQLTGPDQPLTGSGPGLIGPDHRLTGPPARGRWWLPVTLVLLVFALAGWALASRSRAQAAAAAAAVPRPGIPVPTVAAKRGDIGVFLDAIGTVTPLHTASITSQVGGRVVSVQYGEGQHVAQGDALLDIDARAYQAVLAQAQGLLVRDEGLLAQAEMDYQRYLAARASHAIAQQVVDDQEKLVVQDRGVVQNDQGVVRYDQLQVDFCHLVAPFAGRVGLRLVDPGNVVPASGGPTLAVITQMRPITVIFAISEDRLTPVRARLRAGAHLPVEVLDRAARTRIASGVLLALDNQIDTTTGTVKARGGFPNADEALFPNQFVNVRLLVDTLHGVTLIPSGAVQQNGAASYVFVVAGGRARQQVVHPGVSEGGLTEVGEVQPGELVATGSFDRLQDKARVVPEPAAQGTVTGHRP